MTKGGEGVQNRFKMRDVICECSLTCLPSRSNCIRRTLYPAVLGQVDEDESRKKRRLRE